MRRVGSFRGPTYRPGVSETTEADFITHQEDVFEPRPLQRSSSVPNLKFDSPTPDFEEFMDRLPRLLFIKFKTPFWQNLFWSKDAEVQRALKMIVNAGAHWNTPRLHDQLERAGLSEILTFVKKRSEK